MNENITIKVKVITGFGKEKFETELNDFLARKDINLQKVEFQTVVKKYKGDEMLGYVAYITCEDETKGEESENG